MSAFPASKLDNELVGKAVTALMKYEVKKTSEGANGKALLVSNYAKPVLVQIQLFNEVTRAVTKPTRVKIPHSLFNQDEEDNTICLFCRSDDKEAITQYLEKNPIDGLTKVISINDAKKHYVQFKDKKALLNEHTHFVCDSRIAGQLYNILGSTFSARNDYPVQINYTNPAQLPALVQKVVNSTYFRLAGKNISIRIGHTAMKASEVTANILEGLPFAIEKLQNEWKDVHSIHLKTSDSAALPIYSKVPDEMAQYVIKQAASIPAPAAAATTTPAGKGKKTAEVKKAETPKPSTPAPAAVVKEAASGKKRKAETAPEEVAAPAPTPAAAATPGLKSALKKPKAAAEPTTPAAAPKSTTKAAKAATPAPVVEEAPAPVAAPKSAAKAKKTPAKQEKVVEEVQDEEEHEEVAKETTTPARKSSRTPAKTPAAAAAVETTTPAARTMPKRAASARK